MLYQKQLILERLWRLYSDKTFRAETQTDELFDQPLADDSLEPGLADGSDRTTLPNECLAHHDQPSGNDDPGVHGKDFFLFHSSTTPPLADVLIFRSGMLGIGRLLTLSSCGSSPARKQVACRSRRLKLRENQAHRCIKRAPRLASSTNLPEGAKENRRAKTSCPFRK